jgi:hypothetical protein
MPQMAGVDTFAPPGAPRAGVQVTLHGVVFAIFVQALPGTAEGTLCDPRNAVPRMLRSAISAFTRVFDGLAA